MPFIKINPIYPQNKGDHCNSPEHNPPTHIYLEPGEYDYVCPVCGHKQRVYQAGVILDNSNQQDTSFNPTADTKC